ncbi:MAG: hypothetical protein AAB817_01240 [Patescibacteria group bacterium]
MSKKEGRGDLPRPERLATDDASKVAIPTDQADEPRQQQRAELSKERQHD